MRFSTNITKFRLFSTNFRNYLYYNLIFFIKSNRVCKKGLKFDKKVLLILEKTTVIHIKRILPIEPKLYRE